VSGYCVIVHEELSFFSIGGNGWPTGAVADLLLPNCPVAQL